jgi:ribosomal protein S18 acetylase RimI-like enzyme
MQIEYVDYLPDEFRATAIQLYFDALKEKLEPILGSDGREQETLASGIAKDRCLVAVYNQELVGIMGIQTSNGGFVNPSLTEMVKIYGILGGIIRMGGLAILHHSTGPYELYVDGVAVAQEMRGHGIGSCLFDLLEQRALKKGIRTISLEVIDTNPRAKALYEHLGFKAIQTKTIWPINLFLKISFKTATLMVKKMG